MTTNVLHENDNYKVVAQEVDGKLTYVLINKETGVIEEDNNILPEIKIHAEQFNDLLVRKVHEEFSNESSPVVENGPDNVTPFRPH